ncbi:hypothetical protein [Chamaesiphon sp.]|uniref:hypothetical protein n=1 Tax=Chamaesiphon sp. TaxID=2814140 RepID=UPI0035937481
MNNKNFALGLATLALSIANAPNAQAALINGVTATNDMGSFYDINNIVNGSGLPGNIPNLTGTHNRGSGTNVWVASEGVKTGNITFNLNGTYSLAGISLWNFNGTSFLGVIANPDLGLIKLNKVTRCDLNRSPRLVTRSHISGAIGDGYYS